MSPAALMLFDLYRKRYLSSARAFQDTDVPTVLEVGMIEAPGDLDENWFDPCRICRGL